MSKHAKKFGASDWQIPVVPIKGDGVSHWQVPVVPIFVFLVLCLLTCPFGDFPLNDDWQYARLAQRFAQTGQYVVDVPIAPSVVGQSLLSYPIIKLLGFSHTALRGLTVFVSCSCIYALYLLFVEARVSRRISMLGLVCLVLSPMYAYLSLTYMTEIYGLVWGLWAAVIWIRNRATKAQQENSKDLPMISIKVAIISGTLIGFSFWTRQLSIIMFPALVGGSVLCAVIDKNWRLLMLIAV